MNTFPSDLNDEGCVMISLAQRVRDFRYSKGWGPDELASRAEISRTALYQIESGKTGLPRAGTLRRIAVALDVSMDELLGHGEPTVHSAARSPMDHAASTAHGREMADWLPAEGGPLHLRTSGPQPGTSAHFAHFEEEKAEDARFGGDPQRRAQAKASDNVLTREGELLSKLHDLLHTPLGLGIARIIDELHVMIHKNRNLP
jgi:transcriptional regulator with XRE-family HTH domain